MSKVDPKYKAGYEQGRFDATYEERQRIVELIQEYADSQTDVDIQLAIIGSLSLIKELD